MYHHQQGVIGDLRVVGDPLAAERHCEEDDDDSDMVSDNKTHLILHYRRLKCCNKYEYRMLKNKKTVFDDEIVSISQAKWILKTPQQQ